MRFAKGESPGLVEIGLFRMNHFYAPHLVPQLGQRKALTFNIPLNFPMDRFKGEFLVDTTLSQFDGWRITTKTYLSKDFIRF